MHLYTLDVEPIDIKKKNIRWKNQKNKYWDIQPFYKCQGLMHGIFKYKINLLNHEGGS